MVKRRKGFTLLEIVTALLLLGVVASLAGTVMTVFFEGYLATVLNSELAMKCQVALDRISLELRELDTITSAGATTVVYTSGGSTRSIDFQGGSITLDAGDGVDRLLLSSVNLDNNTVLADNELFSYQYDDLNGDGLTDEVAYIAVEFAVDGVPDSFYTGVYPRNMVAGP